MINVDSEPQWPDRPTVLLQVRTGRLEPLEGTHVMSAIRKRPIQGPVRCSELGLDTDEHDLTFHGGPDKALHGYAIAHYDRWRELYPDQQPDRSFEVGSFGENLVCEFMSDNNVCIGDIISIGHESSDQAVICEVSLPRQPCSKLNSRFGIKGFAKQTYRRRMTGWYMRVLRPGQLEAGMLVTLVERKHPQLSITALMHLIYDSEDMTAIEAAEQIPEMGKEAKDYLRNRLGVLARKTVRRLPRSVATYTVERRWHETKRVLGFELVCKDDCVPDDKLKPGSHVTLVLPNGLQRSYSVVSGTRRRFVLGIALETAGRGASRWIHENLLPGVGIKVLEPSGKLPMDNGASHYILIAGGIGITAFTACIARLESGNHSFELHYAVRAGEVAFSQLLPGRGASNRPGAQVTGKLELYEKGLRRLDMRELMQLRPWNSSIFVCGPTAMLDQAEKIGQDLGLTADELHLEKFDAAETAGAPFVASVSTSAGLKIQVGEQDSLLDALLAAGLDVDNSCNVGNCGTCRVRVVHGGVEHRGKGLTDAEKRAGYMLACCSRGKGDITIELSE